MTHTPATPANPAQGVTTDFLRGKIGEIICLETDADENSKGLAQAVELILAAIGAGRSSEPEFETAPDNGTPAEVLAYVLDCARRWVPEARIIGNARAGDIERAIAAIGAGGQAVAFGWITEPNPYSRYGSAVIYERKDETIGATIPLYTHPAPSGQAVAVKPLIWEEDHGIAGMGPYRLFKAETTLGRFVYGTDAEGSAYYHTASSGVMMVGDEVTAKRLAEAAWDKTALAEVGKFVDPAAFSHPPQPADERVVEALREAANIAFDEMFAVTGAPVARAVQQKILALSAQEGRKNG